MEMTDTKKTTANKKITELILKLDAKEPGEVIKAVKGLKNNGDENAIIPLIQLHSTTTNNAIKGEIENLLNTLKSTKVMAVVIDCLTDPQYQNSKQAILASIWNSNLDYTDYLDEIVTAAIDGDMMDAMECLTIFDNIEGNITEEKVLAPLLTLNQYLNDNQGSDDPKYTLLLETTQLLQEINNSL